MSRVVDVALSPVRAMAAGLQAVGGAVAMTFSRGRAGWQVMLNRTRIDYRTEVGDPTKNSAVAASVGWIARNFPEAPVRVRRQNPDGSMVTLARSLAGPGAMLRLMENPNGVYSGVAQWMATVIDYVCRGDSYWIKVRGYGGRPVAYWWVPYHMMEPRWPEDDPTVFIGYYEYRVNGIPYRVETRDVVHFRNGIDPNNPRKGLSQLASLFREIFTDDEASNFTAALLRNLGVPGVVIAPANTMPSGIKVEGQTIKDRFRDTFGADNRGEPMVLTMPLKVDVLSWNPQQLDLKNLRRIPEERISAVTGVPAIVANLGAGLEHSTFTNAGEANRSAFTQGVIPLQRLMAAELEVQALPDFVDTERTPHEVDFDWSKASAMQDAIDVIWRLHESAASKGLITRRAFKVATGQPADDTDDVYVMPGNYVFVPAGGVPPSGTPGGRPPRSSFGSLVGPGDIPLALASGDVNGHHPDMTPALIEAGTAAQGA